MIDLKEDPLKPRARQLCHFALLLALAGCARASPGASSDLLAGRAPIESADINAISRMTDGSAAYEGDAWDSDGAAQFASSRGFAEYDLGAVRSLRCALLQGDDNDDYSLISSLDGKNWSPLFDAGPVQGGGLRTRFARLNARARYLRLSARGGDGRYAVGEVAVFEECPERWQEALPRVRGKSVAERARLSIELFAAALLAFLVLHKRGSARRNLLVALPLAAAAAAMIGRLIAAYPLTELESFLRGAIAALALATLLRESFSPARYPPDIRWTKGISAFLALGALGCYYHFGALQFWDSGKQRHTLVHGFDMRHYFPLAKYFRELRFDGLYDASLAAYIDLHPGMKLEDIGGTKLRDLQTAEMRHARELSSQIAEVRARFSPARWAEFTRDMHYFLDCMGEGGYLGTLTDHGGNATPVWILGAYLLFAHAPANEWVLSLAGLIDPLLVLLLFYAVYRSFGARVALYMAILFGATDFYQFGSNMFGSTLRQDWLVATGLGACALRKDRPLLGGALLAYAGLIRAFPAVAVMMLPAPILWSLLDFWKIPAEIRIGLSLRNLIPAWRAPLRAIAGALLAVVLLVGATCALFGWSASWGNWFRKIEIHATGPNINSVGLRAAIMFEPEHIAERVLRPDLPEPWFDWQRYQARAFERRRALFLAINIAMICLVLLAARGKPLEQVALFGLVLIPFFFYPSNYYCHYIFLLPIAAAPAEPDKERRFALAVAALLALCVAQALTLDVGWSDVRYAWQSFELLIGSVLFVLALVQWRIAPPALATGARD